MFRYNPSGFARDTIVCAIVKGKLKRSQPKNYDLAKREVAALKDMGHPAWMEARTTL